MTVTIPRADFVEAIEEGIQGGSLRPAAASRLRRVGREAAAVGRGFAPRFEGDPCCPATQARLTPASSEGFYAGYDDAIFYSALRTQGGFIALDAEAAVIL